MTAPRRIVLPADHVELAAALEVTKLVAFTALGHVFALRSEKEATENAEGGEDAAVTTARAERLMRGMMENFRRALSPLLVQANVELPPEDADRYRRYAEGVMEELSGLLTVGGDPMKKFAS
jgi:hypothetical protein